MKEYPIEKAYEHDTFLFYKTDWLKICVTIYAPTNSHFKFRRNGNTFYYDTKIDNNSFDTRIIAHPQVDREFAWDNSDTTITTIVVDPDGVEQSTNPIHTDDAHQY